MSEYHTSPHNGFNTPDGLIRLPTHEEIAAMEQKRLEQETRVREAMNVRHEAFKKERRNSRIKKTIAVLALFASVKSGGLIDMAGDALSDAGTTVAGAIEPVRAEVPDEMDGIPFEDYSKKVRTEVMAEQTEYAEQKNNARQTVIDIFSKIDSDGTDWLESEVTAAKAEHPELYVDNALAERTKEAIDGADSNVAAVLELNGFMSEYGISAGFEGGEYDDKQSQTKKALKAYVNVFSVLPKDFVMLTKLEKVTVSGETVQSVNGEGEIGLSKRGDYSDSSNKINVYVDNIVETAIFKLSDAIPNLESSYEQTVAHELGHAIDHNMPIGATLETQDGVVETVTSHSSRIVNGAIGRPEVPSMYSRTDNGEYAAELLSGLLSDSESGLVMPNEWRKFGSKSNKAMIDMLADLEAQYPGIAKILISNRL